MADWTESTLDSPTGAKLHLYSARAEGAAKAVVQINHGMGEHAGRYRRFADFLTARGYHVYAHDHRGHGRTEAEDAPLGHFSDTDGWGKVLDDVGAVNAHIRAEHEGLPVVCFGHSMGSIIAFDYSLRHPDRIDGLSCWNSDFTTTALSAVGKVILAVERAVKGPRAPSNITRKLTFDAWNKTFRPNRTEFDWLSRDPAEVDKYVVDPLCGFPVSIGLWQDTITGLYEASSDERLGGLPKALPVHLQGGSVDPCSDYGKGIHRTAERLQKAGLSDVTVSILDGARHESLNETNRDQVMADYAGWLDGRFGG